MRIILAVVLIMLFASCVSAEDTITIEKMDYPDNASARSVWIPVDKSEPVAIAPEKTPEGEQALSFPCDMSKVKERSYWDRKLSLDLAAHGKVSFWVKPVGDMGALSNATLYFQSGDGWYSCYVSLEGNRWQKVTLDRSSFNDEDDPAGWSEITGIRISFWKAAPKKLNVYIGPFEASSNDIVVVHNTRGGKEAEPWAGNMTLALKAAGIESVTINDLDVEKGALKGKKIAIYPHNPDISEAELDAIDSFLKSGGKIMACYSLTNKFAQMLGFGNLDYARRSYEGQFAQMRIVQSKANKAILGLPGKMNQISWNITVAKPVSDSARVLAQWYDDKGKDTGYPAIVISNNGVFVSHVLLNDDLTNRGRLLRALLGNFDKTLWKKTAKNAEIALGQMFPRWDSFNKTVAGIESEAKKTKKRAALSEIANTRKAFKAYSAFAKSGKWPQALDSLNLASVSLTKAYASVQSSKQNEFRAVWCHSAYGVSGMTWDKAIKILKDNGFTAVVPNMLWGGLADYNSDVLPVNPKVKTEGDQIELCLKAAKKYGVQVHVWKVNWNLDNAPKEFIDKMRAEKRLQASSTGEEKTWLCPSNPDNQKLELDSMLEVAQKYDVDGIHFDYIRYPDSNHCYCESCRERFESESGIKISNWPKDVLMNGDNYEAYQSFRRDNITRLVKAVREGARKIKPDLKVSAAVFSDWPSCREHVGQNWGEWIKLGYLDYVFPMNYTESNSGFEALIQVQKEATGGRIPIYPGIGASAPGLSAIQVIDQVLITRKEGTNGFIIFNYDTGTVGNHIPMLGMGTTKR